MSRKRGYAPQSVLDLLAEMLGVSRRGIPDQPDRRFFRIRKVRSSARIGEMLKVCPGRRHAWFNSSAGVVRKPIHLAEGGAA